MEHSKKARGYLEEVSWLLLEAIKELESCEKEYVPHRAMLQKVRSKVLTSQQFIDLALKQPEQVIVQGGALNTYATLA